MKVGLEGATPDPILTQRNDTNATHPSNQVTDTSVANTSDDKATLSLGRDTIATLTSQAMGAPETRQDKIDALRQSISTGQYKVDPDQVADAILRQASEK